MGNGTAEKENTRLKGELAEAEEYIEQLEGGISEIKNSKKLSLGNLNIGELASVVFEGFIRRNPQLLTKLPGGEALAGILVQDNEEKVKGTPSESEPEVTVKRREPAEEQPSLTEQEKGFLTVIAAMQRRLNGVQMEEIFQIIEKLMNDTKQIKPVMELLSEAKSS